MYKLLNAKTVKPYKSFCSDKLNQLKNIMFNDYGFECDFSLIGSGARNLITQNENEPFDLDYNFYLYSFPEDFDINSTQDLKWLKDTMRTELNNILKDTAFKDAQDSTSVLTARLFFTNDPQRKEFSFDIAILARNKIGNYCRLIHDKSLIERFYWNEVPNSESVYNKAEELKENGWWEDVRDKYLELKNMYLTRFDFHQHPSYVCFVEAVNLIYQQYENY